MKKAIINILSIFLSLAIIVSFLPVRSIAATSYTKEALFSSFPVFLINEESERRMNEMIEPAIELLEANTDSVSLAKANLITVINNGVNILVTDIFNAIEPDLLNQQDTYRLEVARSTMKRTLSKDYTFVSQTNEILSTFKEVKAVYGLGKTAVKVSDMPKYMDVDKLLLTEDQLNDLLRHETTLEVVTKGLGETVELWKLFVTAIEMYEIEVSVIDIVMDAAEKDSDLYKGLSLLRRDLTMSPVDYIAKTYFTNTCVSFIAKKLSTLAGTFLENGGEMALIFAGIKFAAKYMYTGPTMDGLIKGYMLYANYNSMYVALSNYRRQMISVGCKDGGKKYQILYNAYICAAEEFLSQAKALASLSQSGLRDKAAGNLATLEDGLYISYDIHLKLCTEALNAASASGIITTSGSYKEIGTSTSNANLAERIATVQAMYKPNAGIAFEERYGYSLGSFAFVQKVFNLLYDCNMPNTTQNQFRYELYGSQNVEKIGLIRQADMNENNVANLLKQALPGDVLMGYGELGAHCMIVVANENAQLTVYDCDSPYGPSNSNNLIQQYGFSYVDIYKSFSVSNEDRLFAGIALYRAVNRNRVYSAIQPSAIVLLPTEIASGTCGDNLTWKLTSEGILRIHGTGMMTDFSLHLTYVLLNYWYDYAYTPWNDYRSMINTVIIDDGVTSIGNNAFYNCEQIQSVDIPDSVSSIGERAFLGCSSLNSITIPGSTNDLLIETFGGCINLNDVTFKEGVKTIGIFAFSNCPKIKCLNIPKSMREIGSGAFENCNSLSDIYYAGNEMEWNEIQLVRGGGYISSGESLFEANIHYNATLPGELSSKQQFNDVLETAYYSVAVEWAVANGITQGTSSTTFSPDATCTRGQVVTFLWRAHGSPDPKTEYNPFEDVMESDWFYKPVLWAVENGITSGTSTNTFSPYNTCTRGQVVTFLWRSEDKPITYNVSVLAEAFDDTWYTDAVAWADNNGVLNGTDEVFTPYTACPRADIVTYMYRTIV